jgi:hypothetical protein
MYIGASKIFQRCHKLLVTSQTEMTIIARYRANRTGFNKPTKLSLSLKKLGGMKLAEKVIELTGH